MNLAEEMSRLPEPPNRPWPDWTHWRHMLWEVAQHDDPGNFINWPPVYHNMLVRHRPMEQRIVQLSQDLYDAANRLPEPLRGNCMDQAYHVWLWQGWTGRSIKDLSTIKEFGGGYGQMEWLCRTLGFTGDYFVVDLPEGRLLQKWWLETQGIQTCDGNIHDPDLFIGCYSVSEAPYAVREQEVPGAGAYLMCYSEKHGEYDNDYWFPYFMARYADRRWKNWQMEDRPTEWYAIC